MKEAAPMKTPRITDAQVDLLAERLRAVGVGRREFLKVAAGLAAMGPAGFNHRPAVAAPKLAPGEKWADGSPCTARDFEWSWKRQLDPASAAPYAAFLYDIRNAQAFNKKEVTDPNQVGVRAKDDWTLEVTLEGPRGYFPVLAAYLAALPAHRASVEKHADKWTEAAKIGRASCRERV